MDAFWDFLAFRLLDWGIIAALGLASICLGGWFCLRFWRARLDMAASEKPAMTWQEWVATMHNRVDQLEHLLHQFSQRLDKRIDELRESVIELESSVGSLEKPFTAVATRFSELGRDAQRNGRS